MRHIVSFSGGVASWATAKRVADLYGTADMILLFADTKGTSTNPHDGEDEDLYRFLEEAAANVGAPLVRISEGRTIWQVFRDERFIGNHMVDPCSKILKRQMLDRWLKERYEVPDVTSHVGYTFDEVHRFTEMQKHSKWHVRAVLCEAPELFKWDCFALLEREGIALPRLNRMGFQHNNCGGFCIKAGIAQFVHLFRTMPERYAYHEGREQELREHLGKDVAVLRDRSGGDSKPLTLRDLRLRLEVQPTFFDPDDWGGCGCMEDQELAG